MTTTPTQAPAATAALHAIALLSLVTALVGTYWDDAWHTDIGRDSFFSPPHILLFGGIALAGATIGSRALLHLLETRSLRSLISQTGLALSLAGTLVTLASAPIDEIWHTLYGRDAVAWSPPHMLGLVGVLLLVGGIQLDIRSQRIPGARALTHFANAGILATLLVLVFEYDTDVPQFDELWYLPVMTLAMSVAFGLMRGREVGGLPATSAAGGYTVLMSGTIFFLMALGHSYPIVPLTIIPALAYDLSVKRGATLPIRAVVLTLATWIAYQPTLELQGGVRLDGTDTLFGLPLSLAAAFAGLLVTEPRHAPPIRRATLVLLALVASVPTALAHDPGQGEPVADVQLRAYAEDDEWTVSARVEEPCGDIEAERAFARRAGETLEGHVESVRACRLTATLTLPSPTGRWFVYIHFRDANGPLEAWIPLEPGTSEATKETQLYRPPTEVESAAQVVGGALLYVLELGLVGLYLWRARHHHAHP